MDFTGERYVPGVDGEIRQEHLHRYAFAAGYVAGKVVLDAACGEGYGSALLAATAASVLGVDIDAPTIAHARATYGAHRNLRFEQGDVARLPLADASVDVVVSFETLEHLEAQQAMVAEFRRVLKPDGLLIISTPNKAVYSEGGATRNEFHVKELDVEEFRHLLAGAFRQVTLLGQRLATGSTIVAPGDGAAATVLAHRGPAMAVSPGMPPLAAPTYFIALASNVRRLARTRASVLLSSEDDLFLKFRAVARWASGVHEEFRSAQHAWHDERSALQARLSSLDGAVPAPQAARLREAADGAGQALAATQAALERSNAALQAAQLDAANGHAQAAERLNEERVRMQQALRDALESARVREAALDARIGALSTALGEQRLAADLQARKGQERLHQQEEHHATVLAAHAADAAAQAQARALAEQQRATLAERLREAGGEVAALRATLQRQADEATRQQEALRRQAAEQQAGTERGWRQRLAQALRETRRREHATRASGLAVQAALQAQIGRLGDEARQRDEAAAQALQQAQAAARDELLRAHQRADEERVRRDKAWATRLAALDERHAAERAAWEAQRSAEAAAAADREDALRATLQAQQGRHADDEREAAQRVEAARTLAQQQLDAARQREEGLRSLVQQRSQLATLLGRELLALQGSIGWRLWAPLRSARRWTSAPQALQAERGLREMALAATLLQPQPSDWQVPGAAESLPNDPIAMNLTLTTASVQTLDDLLALDDRDFVGTAYRLLLGRAADPDGLQHYLALLAQGRPRLAVLADLRYSKEGRRRGANLPDLEDALRDQRLARIPVLGRLVRRSRPALPLVGVRRDLVSLAGRLHDIDDKLDARLSALEHTLQVGIQGLAQHAMQSEARAESRLAAVEQGLAGGLQVQLQQATRQLETRIDGRAAAADDRLSALDREVGLAVQGLHAHADDSGARVEDRISSLSHALQALRDDALRTAQTGALTQALARHDWPQEETDLWRVAERLLAASPRDFVEQLFRFALGRAPDGPEVDHFLARLQTGSSRLMLVDKVTGAPEFRARQAQGGGARPAAAPATPAAAVAPLPSLPIHAQPVVSVVIPVYGQLDYTLRCLRSIAEHAPAVPFEVIVVDDASPDDSAAVLARVPGVRLLRNDGNQGFIRSCNRGAAAARGTHLCLLNNDTEVAPRWLDELHATFDTFPGTGFVGSKLVYPDGRLQEAGGILWQDGSAWNFGHGQDPTLPAFNYAREVDYCSGASIMLPMEVFRRFGGLDEHYLPAYCEDSDLALKVRSAGLRVIYQPLSQVVHHEGVTSGRDTGSGVKAYQVVNTQKLFARWKQQLARHQPNGVDVERAKDRMSTRRVLVLDHVTATPDQDAGSVTVVNFLTLLREMRFQVTYLPEDNFLFMPGYTPALQRAGFEALYGPYVTTVEQHLAAHGDRYDLVLMWRPQVVERHLATVRRHCPRARVVYHTVDLHYLRMEREARLRDDADGAAAAARMKAVELGAVRDVDAAIVHSTHELEVLAQEGPVDKVFVFPLIVDVPGSRAPFGPRAGIAFIGGYQHVPNVDAVVYFVREVMPLLRPRLPGVQFHIVGSNAKQAVLELACADVVIEGFVAELQPLLDRMRLSVAPLRYGAGIKGKVGNSMAMGLPVVATSVAVEGMQLTDRRDVLIADTPGALADAICELYQDPALWQQVQAHALARVDALSGASASYENLRRLLQGLGLAVGDAPYPLRLYRDGR